MNCLLRNAVVAGFTVTLAALLGACSSAPPVAPRTPEPPPPVKQQEASPKDRANLHAELGAGYYERGQMDVALEELNQAVALDPSNPRIYNIYGLVYAVLGDNPKAEQNFQRALSLSPLDSDVRHNWGWFLCNNGRPREAIAEFEMALRNPLYRSAEVALVNAGRCSVALGDVATAEAYFTRALAIAPNNSGAAYGLALIAFRAGRLDDARAGMRRLMQQALPGPEVLYLGMCIERKTADRTAELSYVAQLRNRYPDTIEAKAVATGICE